MNKDILLCSTLHDPRGVFLQQIKPVSEVIIRGYKGWVINVTQATDEKVVEEIRNLKNKKLYITESEKAAPLVPDKIENDHLFLLSETAKIARNLRIRLIQYTDADRIIVAAKYYPKDLLESAKVASKAVSESNTYLNFRRSVEDYFTHHPPLVQTEFEFNRLYSRAFGIPLDIASTAHVMSFDILEGIVRESPKIESVSFPHPKWLIIAKQMGARILSLETQRILTFETPEQFKKEIVEGDKDADYDYLQKRYMATLGLRSTMSSSEWEVRFRTEKQYLTLLQNHINILGLEPQVREKLRGELKMSLTNLEGRQRVILETLEQGVKDTER